MIQQGQVGAGEAGFIEAVQRARERGILWCAGWAVRLRGAVRRHARLVGPRPEVLRRTSVLELTDLLAGERVEQDLEDARLSWSGMVELLNS